MGREADAPRSRRDLARAAARRLVAWMPEGRALPDRTWARRHRIIVRFALIQAMGVAVYGLSRGFSGPLCLADGFLVGMPALLALYRRAGRRVRTISATVSLMSASAAIVDLAGGSDTAHFHFFVMVGVVSLYQDWAAFGVCVVITVLHHAVFGLLDPRAVYGTAGEREDPVQSALVHGGFVLAACVAHLVAWKTAERQELSDPLTQLPNRTAFVERLERVLSLSDDPVSVCFIDIDDFKQINDAVGHHVGDRALCHVSETLRQTVRRGDFAARLGGDEFAVFVRGQAGTAESFAARLLQLLEMPFLVDGHEVSVRASIGVADSNLAHSRHADDLLRDADLAMYLAKSSGKNQSVTYTAGVDEIVRERAEMAADLRHALSAGQLSVHYQPIVSCGTGRLVGVEALVRWNHPVRGPISPGEFIPMAEETGEIRAIGEWVLLTAARQVVMWQRELPGCADLRLSVNLSAVQLRDDDLQETIFGALRTTALAPRHLTLEVTETVLLLDLELAGRHLDALRSAGVRVAIDDFGTGYSSLSYLSRLPADVIKIDQSFVKELEIDSNPYILVQAVVDMANALQLDTVAEGVERPEQQAALLELGCGRAQGYLYSPAVPAPDFAVFVAGWPARARELLPSGPVPPSRGAGQPANHHSPDGDPNPGLASSPSPPARRPLPIGASR